MWSLKEQVFINVYPDCWIGGSPAVEEKWRGETFWKNKMDVSCKTFVYFLTFHNSEFQVWQYENMHRSSHLLNASMHLNKQILHDAPSPIWSDRISIKWVAPQYVVFPPKTPKDKLTPTKKNHDQNLSLQRSYQPTQGTACNATWRASRFMPTGTRLHQLGGNWELRRHCWSCVESSSLFSRW